MTKKPTAQTSAASAEELLDVFASIFTASQLRPTRYGKDAPVPTRLAGRTLHVAVSTAARRLQEVADALDHAAVALKDAASLEASLAPKITKKMPDGLTPSTQMATQLHDLHHIMREAAEATQARARALRLMTFAPRACAARHRTCEICALRGCKRS